MCGRFNLEYTTEVDKVLQRFGFGGEFRPAYNIAPTEFAPIITHDRDGPVELLPARWWLTPSWSEGPSTKFAMFNARVESLNQSRAFKGPFDHKRCLVPASSFIEWQKNTNKKQPLEITLVNQPMVFAGIWDCWMHDGSPLYSFSIITQPASSEFAPYHSRLPVMLAEQDYDDWLDPHRLGKDAMAIIDNSIKRGFRIEAIDESIGNARLKEKPKPVVQTSLF